MTYGIYKFENKINHKVYIGLSTNLEERYHKHHQNIKDQLWHNEVFYEALRKYGWENFDYTILEQYEYKTENYNDCDLEWLSELEDSYILKYNSLVPNGYNMIRGGTNGSGIAKRKPVEQYDLNGNFIKEYISAFEASIQTGFCHSDICKCCRENNNKMIVRGYQWKYKNSDKIIGPIIDKHSEKRVYQFSTKGELIAEYKNLDKAAEAAKVHKALICTCCLNSNKAKSAGGYYWSYTKENFQIPTYIKKHTRPVMQYTKDLQLINTFESISEAHRQTKVNLANINAVCLGKRKTAGGFIWKFIEEE